MADIKSFFVLLLIGSGIFGLIMFIMLINASWGAFYNAPFINAINGNDLTWIHWWDNDSTPYTYALFVYKPEIWWEMTIGFASIVSIGIMIFLIIVALS